MPDVLQRDVPVPGVGWLDVEHERLVGVEPEGADHVQVVRRGVGCAEVGGLGGDEGVRLVQQLGLDGAVQRGQLHQRPRHRGELFGRCVVGQRRRRVAVERLDAQGGGSSFGGVADVLADDDRRRVLGDLHPLRTVEIGG